MTCDPNGALTVRGISSGGDYQRMIEELLKHDVAVVRSEFLGQGEWKLQIARPDGLAMQRLVAALRNREFEVT